MNEMLSQLWSLGWPQWVLVIGAFTSLLVSVGGKARAFRVSAFVASVTFLISGFGFWQQWQGETFQAFSWMVFDPLGNLLGLLIALIGLVTVLFSFRYWEGLSEPIAEAVPLIVFATFGMTLMVSTTQLLTLILGLELMSLSLYVLVGTRRPDPKASEGAFKYFLLGSVAAAFMLFGIALLYGVTGTLDVMAMGQKIIPPDKGLIFHLGVLLLFLGFAFKVAAVPLHFWAPDVYDGAPVPVTGFMAAGVKVAAFGALIRLLQGFAFWEALELKHLLTGLALATMIVGNLTALRQKSVKRIMAYSSISHAGYLLLGLVTLVQGGTFRSQAISPILFYLATYALLTLGIFAVLTALSSRGKEIGELDDLRGLGEEHPGMAACLSIFLISLAGIPPSAGFLAKYYLFAQVIAVGLYPLAVVGILMSAVSLYYYLAPVVRMYFYDKAVEGALPQWGVGLKCLVTLMVIAVFYLGLFPGRPLKLVQQAKIFAPAATAVQVKDVSQ